MSPYNKTPYVIPLGLPADGTMVECEHGHGCQSEAKWAVGWRADGTESYSPWLRCDSHASEFCDATNLTKPNGLT